MRHPVGLVAELAGLDRPLVMGVLNVTPDSFSDGGRFETVETALSHAKQLIADGADIVDVGGESTRPGSTTLDGAVERDRALPVVRALVEAGIPTSIDTMRGQTAVEAVALGACLVNDVSGGRADPEMYSAIASLTVPYVTMHWRGHGSVMDSLAVYGSVVGEVRAEIDLAVSAAVAAGVDERRIVIDPGLGFAKKSEHNWALLRNLDAFIDSGLPVLIGASRKRFLGELLADPSGSPRPVHERDRATDAVTVLAAAAGAWGVRVHDPAHTRDAIAVGRAWRGEP
jgi:dihydropteroate synthase